MCSIAFTVWERDISVLSVGKYAPMPEWKYQAFDPDVGIYAVSEATKANAS